MRNDTADVAPICKRELEFARQEKLVQGRNVSVHPKVRKSEKCVCACRSSYIAADVFKEAVWSSGMIPASGAGGPGFKSWRKQHIFLI